MRSRASPRASRRRPTLALVDIRPSPGDGRVVARELGTRFATLVLFASAHVEDLRREPVTGAPALCLEKPYDPATVPAALVAAPAVAAGRGRAEGQGRRGRRGTHGGSG
jgi:DNA-binding response OmpR family regulator